MKVKKAVSGGGPDLILSLTSLENMVYTLQHSERSIETAMRTARKIGRSGRFGGMGRRAASAAPMAS